MIQKPGSGTLSRKHKPDSVQFVCLRLFICCLFIGVLERSDCYGHYAPIVFVYYDFGAPKRHWLFVFIRPPVPYRPISHMVRHMPCYQPMSVGRHHLCRVSSPRVLSSQTRKSRTLHMTRSGKT